MNLSHRRGRRPGSVLECVPQGVYGGLVLPSGRAGNRQLLSRCRWVARSTGGRIVHPGRFFRTVISNGAFEQVGSSMVPSRRLVALKCARAAPLGRQCGPEVRWSRAFGTPSGLEVGSSSALGAPSGLEVARVRENTCFCVSGAGGKQKVCREKLRNLRGPWLQH